MTEKEEIVEERRNLTSYEKDRLEERRKPKLEKRVERLEKKEEEELHFESEAEYARFVSLRPFG